MLLICPACYPLARQFLMQALQDCFWRPVPRSFNLSIGPVKKSWLYPKGTAFTGKSAGRITGAEAFPPIRSGPGDPYGSPFP